MAAVGETGSLFVSLITLTMNPQRIRGGTKLGRLVPVAMIYRANPRIVESCETEVSNEWANYVHKSYEEMKLQTVSELPFSGFEFLSSSDPSETGFSGETMIKENVLTLI